MDSTDDHREAPRDNTRGEIGYCKPPKHTRFQPGRSGNPRGRRKGVRNLETDVKRTLKIPIRIKDNGRSRRISTQEGALMVLREKALGGDARALDHLLQLAGRFNNEASEIGPTPALSASDQEILDAFKNEIAANSQKSPTAEPLIDEAADPTQDIEPS